MTIITYAVGSKASTMYTATVNGNSLPLWSRTTDTHFNTPYWAAATQIEQSFCTYAADESALITVSRTSGPVTAAKVYTNDPSGPIIAHTIVGGACRFTLPVDTIAWVEINNNRGQPLIISSRPLVATPSGPTVDTWDGTQTRAVAGRTLLFGPGVHTIGQSFEVDPGASVFFHGEAWVVGSFLFVPGAGGARWYGHGVLSGEWGAFQRAWIRTQPYDNAITYALVRGAFASLSDSRVEGVTLVDPPFYATNYGPNIYDRVSIIGPWWGNANAFFPGSKFPELTASVTKCAAFVHDDVFDFGEYLESHSATDCIVGSIASAAFIVAYWPAIDSRSTHTGTRTTIVCLNYAVENAGSIIAAWCDGGSIGGGFDEDETFHVVSDVEFNGVRFVGSQINGIAIDLRNKIYPVEFGLASGQGLGQIRKFWFRDISFETVPTFRSKIQGKDRINTPHDIWFENVFFAGVRLTVANAATYFDINEFPYNIYIDGIPLRPNTTSTGSWYVTDPEFAPFSYQPLPARLNDGRVYDGPQIWLPSGAVLPSRGPFRNVTTPANWSASDVQLSAVSNSITGGSALLLSRVAIQVASAGVSAAQAGLRVRQALSALSQGGAIGQAGLVKINPNQLTGTSSGVSSASGGLAAAVAMRGTSNGTSAARADLFAPGTVVLSGQSTGTSTGTARLSAISQESSSQGEIMKQRIYNALLAVCQAGPFYKADVNVKTGQMSVFVSQKEQPLAVDIVEVSKEFREAANYRRAYNIGEIASWVFAVTVRFRSGVRVSCETFEEQVADTGIKVPEAKGVVSSRPLLARLTDSRYDEAPAQNPNLGTVVVFTFEVVPETLRK